MKKMGMLPKLLIGAVAGILVGLLINNLTKEGSNTIISSMMSFIAGVIGTYTTLFGSFLKFIVPLIILGLIIPGIADLGKKAGKMLTFTTVLSYLSSIIAGFSAYIIGTIIIPIILKLNQLIISCLFLDIWFYYNYFKLSFVCV